MIETCIDLLVSGVGMAGLTAAHKCARDGWSVGVVGSRPHGGSCALRGCDPKNQVWAIPVERGAHPHVFDTHESAAKRR